MHKQYGRHNTYNDTVYIMYTNKVFAVYEDTGNRDADNHKGKYVVKELDIRIKNNNTNTNTNTGALRYVTIKPIYLSTAIPSPSSSSSTPYLLLA